MTSHGVRTPHLLARLTFGLAIGANNGCSQRPATQERAASVASTQPIRVSEQQPVLWCPGSRDSVIGMWLGDLADTLRRNALGGRLNPPGIWLRRDGTVWLAHAGSETVPYRWTYTTARCELSFFLARFNPVSAQRFQADVTTGRIAQFDSSARRVVLILERDPARFFFKGTYYRRWASGRP